MIGSGGTSPSEIKELLQIFGRTATEGQIKGDHLSKILSYLQRKKTERYKSTLAKLALICGMNVRYVRENYLEGLIEFGVIQVHNSENDVFWTWIGRKAFDRNISETLENNGGKKK